MSPSFRFAPGQPRRAEDAERGLRGRLAALRAEEPEPVVPDVLTMGYRVVVLLRWLLAAQAVVTNVMRFRDVAHPWAMIAATAVIVLWTVVTNFMNRRSRLFTGPVMVSDMMVTIALVGLSPWVLGPPHGSYLSLPVYWALVAPMAVAVWRGFGVGLVSGAVVGLAVAITSRLWTAPTVALMLMHPVAAGAMGMLMDGVRQVMAQRDREQARAAAVAERERLNRIVHDGTLQVLALVEREGRTLGPKGLRLSKLASQQEAKLRTLLQDRSIGHDDTRTSIDLVTVLDRHQSDVLTVSAMASEVLIPAHDARELDQAVAELIANVNKHAGPDAHAWLLLEQEDDDLVVWFRDDGVGMTAEQLDAARVRGRMGITGSVAGRMEALGGSAMVTSRPGKGVEWELRIPAPTE